MNNYTENLLMSLIYDYVCPTLEGNHISCVYGSFYIWKIKDLSVEGDRASFVVKYYSGDQVSSFSVDKVLSRKTIEKLLQISFDAELKHSIAKIRDSLFLWDLNDLLVRDKECDYYSTRLLMEGLVGANSHFRANVDFCKLDNNQLRAFMSSDIGLEYLHFGKMYVRCFYMLYDALGYGNNCYRRFFDMKDEEKKEMLKYANIKFDENDKVHVDDPFDKTIYVEREETREVVHREWIPEKTVREWDVLEWSSYTIPGYWEETTEKKEEMVKEEASKDQLTLARKYCLTKNIAPARLIKDAL